MTTTHTPGPWYLNVDTGEAKAQGSIYSVPEGQDADLVFDLSKLAILDEEKNRLVADLRLVEAAPDLLAALESIAPYIPDQKTAHGKKLVRLAAAAIAKAKGGA